MVSLLIQFLFLYFRHSFSKAMMDGFRITVVAMASKS